MRAENALTLIHLLVLVDESAEKVSSFNVRHGAEG
jgi:hypothetical protein